MLPHQMIIGISRPIEKSRCILEKAIKVGFFFHLSVFIGVAQ